MERIRRLWFWLGALVILAGLAHWNAAWAATGIDMGWLGTIDFSWDFCVGFLSIVLIDLVLAGDNAVVIALAVKSLHGKQRTTGIIAGAGAAVALRVVLTFFVAQLLTISFIKLLGGMLILWIAVKLFIEGAPEDKFQKPAATFWQAIRVIVIADLIMSTDNILAVAGACKGNFFLLLFGLALSIPFVVFTSSLLSMLMDKYPIIVWIGAAVQDPPVRLRNHRSRRGSRRGEIIHALEDLQTRERHDKRNRAVEIGERSIAHPRGGNENFSSLGFFFCLRGVYSGISQSL
jgi:YjbE family integral membrane protein